MYLDGNEVGPGMNLLMDGMSHINTSSSSRHVDSDGLKRLHLCCGHSIPGAARKFAHNHIFRVSNPVGVPGVYQTEPYAAALHVSGEKRQVHVPYGVVLQGQARH